MSPAANKFHIRPLLPSDQAFLWDALHVALWDPPPAPLRPREILDRPDVRRYAANWGGSGDVGVLGELAEDQTPVGAAWMRLLPGGDSFGYVDELTPQFGIAVLPPFHRRGLGRRLLQAALAAAREQGYSQVALTVHPENPALRLYESCGFRKIEIRTGYHLMIAPLGAQG